MIDSHLHLQDERLQAHLAGILATVRGAGVSRMLVNGTHPEDWASVENLSFRFPGILPSFGLHPWWVSEVTDGWGEMLEAFLQRNPSAGVGEIGLDKWIKGANFNRQREVFTEQLKIAQRLSRPVSMHCLQAWGSLRECLDRSDLAPGFLLHSYSGPLEMVGDFVDRGAYFSISGYFFRPEKADKLSLFESIPDDRILLETDSPDMMPPIELVKFPLPSGRSGGAVNHPGNITSIYEAFSAWRGIPVNEVIKRTRENFETWFFDGERKRFAGNAGDYPEIAASMTSESESMV